MPNNDNPTTKFRVDISELKSGITEANRLIRVANSEFKAASSGMDDWANSTDGLSAKIKQLNTVQAQEEAKLKNLKQQYALVVAEQGENSRGAQELAIKINNQQAAVNRTARELSNYESRLETVKQAQANAERSGKTLAEELKNIDDAANDAGDAAEDSGDGYTILKDIIADLATKALTAAIDGFKNLAIEGEAALDILQAKTGTSSKDMEGLADVAQNIFKNGWGQSIDEVTEALGTVKNMTDDLDNATLQNITENAMTLSDVFGWDITESMRATNSLMNQFGITSDEAFNLMTQGAQNGLDQNDDLLDTINEYSVQFANAGFSADDMFNMLNNGAKDGTWSIDKLGDAVKEYNIRWNDGTAADALTQLGYNADEMAAKMTAGGEDGAKAMQAVMVSLSGVEDEQERYKLGQELMGTMWEDLGEDAVMALMDTSGAIDKTKGSMDQVKTDAYDNLATSATTFGRTIMNEIIQPLVDVLAPIVTDIFDFLSKHKNVVVPMIMGIATALGILAGALAIQGLISGVQKAFLLLNGTMAMNPIVKIVAVIAGLVVAFITLWKKSEAFREFWIGLWESIKEAVQPVIDVIVDIFNTAWDAIKSVWNTVKPFFLGIWEGIKSVFSVVKDVLGGFFSGAWEYIKFIFSLAGAYFQAVWDVIKGVFTVVKDVLSGDFSGAWEAIKGIFSSVGEFFGTVWDLIKAPFEAVGSWFSGIFQSAYDGIVNVFNKIGGFFSGVWDTITGIFKAVGTTISDAITGSVKSAINTVLGGAVGIINGFISAINFAIKWINKIPGVDIKKLDKLETPQLAKGGIVDRATLATIGEDGKEAVIPLERNTGWIKGLAASLVKELDAGGGAGGSASGAVVNNYNFTQTNNSPKSLSRLDIYRQTKNQFRLLKEV